VSEERSSTAHLVEDLSVLSRRGALSAAERLTLAEALDANAPLATAHQLGLDFDQVAAVKPGDDALIADVATRAVRRGRPARFPRFRPRVLLLAATLALAGSAAAWWQRTRAAEPARPAAAPQPSTSAAPLASPHGPFPAAGVAASADLVSSPAPVNAVSTAPAPSPRLNEPSGRPIDSAELLFREANAARRAGDQASARTLYLRLQRDFPASDEAHLAHVSLGNLLLSMGRAGEAEQQFAAYLRGRSALAQEALVGRAQSLAALGRSSDERAVWQGLLHDYPSSVYAGRAKQRLAELARSASRPQ
jgi:TolA-binding protein